MTEQNEPSMEAILASIRNILAEDDDDISEKASESQEKSVVSKASPENKQTEKNDSSVSSEKRIEAESVVEPQEDSFSDDIQDMESAEDVLDLTSEMIVDEPRKKQAPQPEKIEEPEEVKEDDDDDFTPEPVIPQEPMKEETLTDLSKENAAKQQFENDLLLAEPTVVAATESLSHLRDIAAERQLELGNASLTIESIVRETLKPYLKEWLDSHLPDIVERVVRKEVAHIMDRLDLK